MRITERDAQQRRLNNLYSPAEPQRLMPTELADEIVLTHPAQPWSASLESMVFVENAGAAGVVEAFTTEPLEEQYFWFQAIQATHTDPIDRDLRIEMDHIATGIRVTLIQVLAAVANRRVTVDRPIVVPRGFRLRVAVNAIAAGENVQLNTARVIYVVAEIPPAL